MNPLAAYRRWRERRRWRRLVVNMDKAALTAQRAGDTLCGLASACTALAENIRWRRHQPPPSRPR